MAHFNTGEQADVHGRTKKRPITLPRPDGPMQSDHIPIIDLFAGPGGLGEGFSALRHNGRQVFNIALSIEKDLHAHRTLKLRAFYRQFPDGEAPEDYYRHLRNEIGDGELFHRWPEQAKTASQEAWHAELGSPKFPKALIDKRIENALEENEDWVLIGGPPCQAFSLVGRARLMGESMERYENDKRHHLYRRYLRIIAKHEPPVFVMENVKGLLSARRREQGVFAKILRDLEYPLRAESATRGEDDDRLHYSLFPLVETADRPDGLHLPEDFVVRMEEYGIPQARHRVIILGIRDGFSDEPGRVTRQDPVTIERAIRDLPPLRSGLSREPDGSELWQEAVRETPYMDWVRNNGVPHSLIRRLRQFAADVPRNLSTGGEFIPGTPDPQFARDWLRDKRLNGFCNHSTRTHIREDLHRYFYAAAYAKEKSRSPRIKDFPPALRPAHESVEDALNGHAFNDRFRVQLRNQPATTVVSHISKDGHYYIHYDPTQCRSLTVREAARLQTFPDNYFFEGPRTQQYSQVGNAVPPLLAYKIAEIVADLFR